jgi:catecholate siderophore receptor
VAWLTKSLSLIGSLRLEHYHANFTSVAPNGVATPISTHATLFNPRVSAVYEPSKTSTFYLSWGRSAVP